jgi:hypothetical protein
MQFSPLRNRATLEFRWRSADHRKTPMNRVGSIAITAASALSEIALFASTRFKRLRRHAISFAIRKRRFRKFTS